MPSRYHSVAEPREFQRCRQTHVRHLQARKAAASAIQTLVPPSGKECYICFVYISNLQTITVCQLQYILFALFSLNSCISVSCVFVSLSLFLSLCISFCTVLDFVVLLQRSAIQIKCMVIITIIITMLVSSIFQECPPGYF